MKDDGGLLEGGFWSTHCYYDLENYCINVTMFLCTVFGIFLSLKLVSNNDGVFCKWISLDL